MPDAHIAGLLPFQTHWAPLSPNRRQKLSVIPGLNVSYTELGGFMGGDQHGGMGSRPNAGYGDLAHLSDGRRDNPRPGCAPSIRGSFLRAGGAALPVPSHYRCRRTAAAAVRSGLSRDGVPRLRFGLGLRVAARRRAIRARSASEGVRPSASEGQAADDSYGQSRGPTLSSNPSPVVG